jgi:hypothetical protein
MVKPSPGMLSRSEDTIKYEESVAFRVWGTTMALLVHQADRTWCNRFSEHWHICHAFCTPLFHRSVPDIHVPKKARYPRPVIAVLQQTSAEFAFNNLGGSLTWRP